MLLPTPRSAAGAVYYSEVYRLVLIRKHLINFLPEFASARAIYKACGRSEDQLRKNIRHESPLTATVSIISVSSS